MDQTHIETFLCPKLFSFLKKDKKWQDLKDCIKMLLVRWA